MTLMYSIWYSNKFKKDIRRAIKRGHNINQMQVIIELLASGQYLPEKYKDHQLTGN